MSSRGLRSVFGGIAVLSLIVSVIALGAAITCPAAGGLCEGTDNSDTITGSANADTILADSGLDTVDAGDGDDVVNGGEGADTLNGQGGNDLLAGEEGNDLISGGPGNDVIFGNQGNDILDGGDDNDVIFGGTGNDIINGGKGNDRLFGNNGNDNIKGEDGDDLLRGGNGNDNLDGGKGSDQLFGGAGNDNLSGGEDDDFLSGGQGDDNEEGGPGVDTYDPDNPGNDTFTVRAGDVPASSNESIFCGKGKDRVVFIGAFSTQFTQSGSFKVYNDPQNAGGTYSVNADCENVSVLASSASLVVEPLSLAGYTVSSNVLSGDSIEFAAEGTGIQEMTLQVYALSGRKLVEQTEKTGYLEFEGTAQSGTRLANGVYLYTLSVKGIGGKLIKGEVRKLLIRR